MKRTGEKRNEPVARCFSEPPPYEIDHDFARERVGPALEAAADVIDILINNTMTVAKHHGAINRGPPVSLGMALDLV